MLNLCHTLNKVKVKLSLSVHAMKVEEGVEVWLYSF